MQLPTIKHIVGAGIVASPLIFLIVLFAEKYGFCMAGIILLTTVVVVRLLILGVDLLLS